GVLRDTAVRLLDQRRHPLGARERAGIRFLERCRGELRCDLARLRTPHAVRHREERRRDHIGILVPTPLAAGVARSGVRADSHASNLSSVAPTRTTSPCTSLRGRSMRTPFTYVPFVEPRSCTQTPSRRGSTRTCRADA